MKTGGETSGRNAAIFLNLSPRSQSVLLVFCPQILAPFNVKPNIFIIKKLFINLTEYFFKITTTKNILKIGGFSL